MIVRKLPRVLVTGAVTVAVGAAFGLSPVNAEAATSAWTSVGPAHVSGTISAFATVQRAGKIGQWAFATTSNETPNGYPSVYSRSGNGTWAKDTLPGSKPGETFVAAAAISPTDVLAFSDLRFGGSREWQWNGHRWSVIKTFPAQLQSATVLSARDIYVFGAAPPHGTSFGTFGLGVYHYNGTTWKRIASTLLGGSATSATNAWAYTGTTIAHWNGSRWTGTNVAGKLPRGHGRLVSVLQTDGTVYAVAAGYRQQSDWVAILTLTGSGWKRIADFSGLIAAPQTISPDADGGIWLPLSHANGTLIVHYIRSVKRITTATLPGGIETIARVADTAKQLAGGSVLSGTANPATYAEIELYR